MRHAKKIPLVSLKVSIMFDIVNFAQFRTTSLHSEPFDLLAIQGFHSQNFCAIFAERNAKFFFLCASVLREKTTICAIIRKSHFAQNCPSPLLRNSSFAQFRNKSFAQFRNFVKIKRLVTVCVSQNSILEKSCFGLWNVFLLVTFTN